MIIKPTRTTIKDQVYSIIREMILRQKYQLGEKINIDSLSATLNVSNSPIREALTMLEKQGLVRNIPNMGSYVIQFSPSAYRELCDTLLVIIMGCYDICLHQHTMDAAIRDMREALRLQKSTLGIDDIYTFLQHTLAFDKCIVTATKNSYLISIYEQMEDVFFLMVLYSHQRSDHEHRENIYEHSMILESMEKGDVAAAKSWLEVHYDKHFSTED